MRLLNLPGSDGGTATIFPSPPDITVEKDGVTYTSVPRDVDASTMITMEFMMEYPFLRTGDARLENPQALEITVFSDILRFSSYFTLRNASTPASVGRAIFDSLLGTWTTTVNNSLGSETCSSTIRECGGCLCEGVCVRMCLCEGVLSQKVGATTVQ